MLEKWETEWINIIDSDCPISVERMIEVVSSFDERTLIISKLNAISD